MEFQQAYPDFNLKDKFEVDGGSIDIDWSVELERNEAIQEVNQAAADSRVINWQEEEDVAIESRPRRNIRRPPRYLE